MEITIITLLSMLFAYFCIQDCRERKKFARWRKNVVEYLGPYREHLLSDDLAKAYWAMKMGPSTTAAQISESNRTWVTASAKYKEAGK